MASYGAKKPDGSHEPDKNIQEMRKQVQIYAIMIIIFCLVSNITIYI